MSFSNHARVCLFRLLLLLSFNTAVVFFLSDDVIRPGAKSHIVEICLPSTKHTCEKPWHLVIAAHAERRKRLLYMITHPGRDRRMQRNRKRKEETGVGGQGAISQSHLQGIHLAFMQWPGGISYFGFRSPCLWVFLDSFLSPFPPNPQCLLPHRLCESGCSHFNVNIMWSSWRY